MTLQFAHIEMLRKVRSQSLCCTVLAANMQFWNLKMVSIPTNLDLAFPAESQPTGNQGQIPVAAEYTSEAV